MPKKLNPEKSINTEKSKNKSKRKPNSKSNSKRFRSFQGAMTALVTPFKKNKNREVDYDALKKLVEFQIKNKIDVLVPVGTTGESPTLSDEEKLKVVKTVIEQSNGRVPVVAGAGSNDTAKSMRTAKAMEKLGADGETYWQSIMDSLAFLENSGLSKELIQKRGFLYPKTLTEGRKYFLQEAKDSIS